MHLGVGNETREAVPVVGSGGDAEHRGAVVGISVRRRGLPRLAMQVEVVELLVRRPPGPLDVRETNTGAPCSERPRVVETQSRVLAAVGLHVLEAGCRWWNVGRRQQRPSLELRIFDFVEPEQRLARLHQAIERGLGKLDDENSLQIGLRSPGTLRGALLERLQGLGRQVDQRPKAHAVSGGQPLRRAEVPRTRRGDPPLRGARLGLVAELHD